MKNLVIIACLLATFAAGWYLGKRQEHKRTADAIEEGLAANDASETLEAIRSVKAISSLADGDTNESVRLLAGAVANYYALHTDMNSTNDQTAKVLTAIKNLAATNRTVADRIAETVTNYQWPPVRTNAPLH